MTYVRIMLAGLMLLGLAACETTPGEDFEYTPADEPPPGPGLFSGEDGVFRITIDD